MKRWALSSPVRPALPTVNRQKELVLSLKNLSTLLVITYQIIVDLSRTHEFRGGEGYPEIFRKFGLRYALAPYVYLLVSFVAVDVCMPFHKMNREIGRFRAESWGMYRFALARVDAQIKRQKAQQKLDGALEGSSAGRGNHS